MLLFTCVVTINCEPFLWFHLLCLKQVRIAGFFFKVKSVYNVSPTNNALLIDFLLSSDAEIFVAKLRLSVQVGRQNMKKLARDSCVFRPSSHFAFPRWWLGLQEKKKRLPTHPTNSTLLIDFLLSSDAEIFVAKLRLSIHVGRRNVQRLACDACACSDRASIFACHPCCWLGRSHNAAEHRDCASCGTRVYY